MHRQAGFLTLDERGLAVRGVLLRHLVMPGMPSETGSILRWAAGELGPGTYVNLMAQYYPAGRVERGEFLELDRRLWREEFEAALVLADSLGLRLDARSRGELRSLARAEAA
jgi:putative pyruvate formate lyase activating enzyme